MSRTYKATGINLKSTPFGESDRLVTVLTREFGLIRALAPGARKHNSSLGGRSGMFVVNELLIAKGKSLDKITQAHTVKTYPGLSQDLGKLAASQYLAEIVLTQALSEQPQAELYELLTEHIQRLELLPNWAAFSVLAHLAHAVFHLLALAGVTPQVQACCLTQLPVLPNWDEPGWQVGFSIPTGGVVTLAAWESLRQQAKNNSDNAIASTTYQTIVHQPEIPTLSVRLNATELTILQQLSQPEIMQVKANKTPPLRAGTSWLSVEQILRSYAQYHLGHQIRSAALIDTYIASMPTAYINHDATV